MLKCGQKDNKNYTFGVTQEQMVALSACKEKVENKSKCLKCSCLLPEGSSFCPSCGERV